MSLKNLLDLRKKEVQIIERIIFQKRSWKAESFKLLAVIAVVSTIIYGISNADVKPDTSTHQSKTIGVYGVISDITGSAFTLTKKTKPTELTSNIYTVTTVNIKKIETKNYTSFSLSDFMEGDTVIVQGTDENNIINASRIIFFSHASTTPVTATSTTSTASTTETASTTTSSSGIIDTIKDTVSNVVDTLTGTTTSTSTEEATTTATTSIQVATTTEATTTETASSTPTLVEKVVEVVTDAVNKVIDTVTQQISPTENSDGQAGTSSSNTPETPAPTLDIAPASETPSTPEVPTPAPSSEAPPAETTTN